MEYISELELKREIVLINNSAKIDENTLIYDNRELLDKIQEEYNKETYNIRKSKIDERFIKELEKCYIPNYSKEKFGMMILLMIKNILKKHCFAGYTQEYKEDFSIDAISKIFLYMHNFNPSKISKRTGKKVKAFAYLTQIISQAFISVINKRNDEKRKSKEYETISYSSLYSDSVLNSLLKNKQDNFSKIYEREKTISEYKEIKVNNLDEIIPLIKEYNSSKALRIVYPDEIPSMSIELYNSIIEAKPPELEIIITKEYKKEKKAKKIAELEKNNDFTNFGEEETINFIEKEVINEKW